MPRLLSRADLPTTHDLLAVESYAEALARFVLTCETPMTVGIQGEWGSGKSSLMRMVQERLLSAHWDAPSHLQKRYARREPYRATDRHKDTRKHLMRGLKGIKFPFEAGEDLPAYVFTFETWQFGVLHPEELGGRLIQALTDQMGADVERAWNELKRSGTSTSAQYLESGAARLSGVLRAGWRAAQPVAAAVAHGATGGVVDGAALMTGFRGDAAPDPTDLALRHYKDNFASFVQQALIETGHSRAVIFIDDLDRVRPAHAVTMLEVLKNFLDVEGCVFLLACDYEVVRAGVEEKFQIRDPRKAKAFFDKIIQVPFDVPVEQFQIRGMLSAFLEEKEAVRRRRSRTAPATGDIAKDPLFVNEIAPLVQSAIGQNPRTFKRFLNTLELLHQVVQVAGVKKKRASVWEDFERWFALVSLVAMQVRWPNTARWVAGGAAGESSARVEQVARNLEHLRRAVQGDAADGDEFVPDALFVDAEEECGKRPDLDALKQTAVWEDLGRFLAHLLVVLDVRERNGVFEEAEVQEFATIGGYLSVTARGRPMQLTGRDKFERAALLKGPAGLFLLQLNEVVEHHRHGLPGVTSVAAYESGIYYQLRWDDGERLRLSSILQIHADGHLLVRRRPGTPPLTEALPEVTAAGEPYGDDLLEDVVRVSPEAVAAAVGSGKGDAWARTLARWARGQWEQELDNRRAAAEAEAAPHRPEVGEPASP